MFARVSFIFCHICIFVWFSHKKTEPILYFTTIICYCFIKINDSIFFHTSHPFSSLHFFILIKCSIKQFILSNFVFSLLLLCHIRFNLFFLFSAISSNLFTLCFSSITSSVSVGRMSTGDRTEIVVSSSWHGYNFWNKYIEHVECYNVCEM